MSNSKSIETLKKLVHYMKDFRDEEVRNIQYLERGNNSHNSQKGTGKREWGRMPKFIPQNCLNRQTIKIPSFLSLKINNLKSWDNETDNGIFNC